MNYDWDFAVLRGSGSIFLNAILLTLLLTLIVVVTGTVVGILYAILHRLVPRPLRLPLLLAMDIVRSLPLYVLILFTAYVLPQLLPFARGASAFALSWIALSAYLAAQCADVTRGALESVPRGAIDAGLALGLSRRRVLGHIELPIALRATIPTQALLWIGMLKNSSIAAVIGVYELAHVADSIGASTHRGPEAYVVVAIAFVFLVLPFAWLARRIERAVTIGPRFVE